MEPKQEINIVLQCCEDMAKRHSWLTEEIARLTSFGAVYATEYWKDGRYLYLMRPMRNGKRKKEYIGNHPLRIEEARKKVKNWIDRDKCIQEQSVIEQELYEVDGAISSMLKVCSYRNVSAKSAFLNRDFGYKKFLKISPNCTQKEHE